MMFIGNIKIQFAEKEFFLGELQMGMSFGRSYKPISYI